MISFTVLVTTTILSAQPKRGTVVINGEFGAAFVWDGFCLQEKEISDMFEFGMTVDSLGYQVYNGRLNYRHFQFGPLVDAAVYFHPHFACGAGYGYQWIDQFVRYRSSLENSPGGHRLSSSHQLRGLFLCTINLKDFDEFDIIGIPFYVFGNVTRIPLAKYVYYDKTTAEGREFLNALNEPVTFKGYGIEIRVRFRHLFNNWFYIHGSVHSRVQKFTTEKDPLVDDVSTTPQGSAGLTVGLGIMIGGKAREKKPSLMKGFFIGRTNQ